MSIDIAAVSLFFPGPVIVGMDPADADFHYDEWLAAIWSEPEADAYAPPPDITVSEWADANRVLQAGISRNPGPWRTDYTPYLREVMDAYSNPAVRHLVFCAGTQLGKTEALYNILGYIIDHDPYPTLLMMPREDDAKLVSRTRVQPMINDCESLQKLKPKNNGLFQTLEMHFPGMVLYLVGANSLAGLASKPCRNILRDEGGKYPDRLGDDADPFSKSEERAKSFWDIRKVVDVSSPTMDNKDILLQLAGCDVIHVVHHPCPHCKKLIRLYMPQIKYDDDRDDRHRLQRVKRSAVYVCQRCGAEITNDERPWMIANYQYVAQSNIEFGLDKEHLNLELGEIDFEPEQVGLWVSSLSSPMLSWGDIAEAWVKANMHLDETGDNTRLQNLINDWFAEPWLVTTKKSTTEEILARKCERPPLMVPDWAVALTCGIDVQKFGFWFSVWAFGADMRSAMIHYGFIETYGDLEQLVFETDFAVENSQQRMGIWRAAMDIGGGEDSVWGDDWTKTEEIVTWIRENGRGVVFPVKGMSVNKTGQKIKHSIMDRMPGQKGGKIPGGLVLWLLDTYQLKDSVFWRFSQDDSGPQAVDLHCETGDDYGLQMVAEVKRRNRNGGYEYVRVKKDNHLLDTTIYAHAAADFQWMGGVKILSAPLYSVRVPVQARRPVVRGEHGGRDGLNVSDRLRRRR